MKTLKYKRIDIIRGIIIYPLGDSIAAILLNEFSWIRLLGMMLVGGLIYSYEIPKWFAYISKYTGVKRTLMAILYFNPLWIARHLIFIAIFSKQFSSINLGLFIIVLKSFAVNIPVAFAANYIIQNKIQLKHRFLASAVFSSLMAIYYALSTVIFK